MLNVRTKLLDRLIVTDSGCWEFSGCKDTSGYGIVWDGKNKAAHRISYEYHIGPINNGLLVLHKCDNPPCCNPDHLFLGTKRTNYEDMISKGREYVLKGAEIGSSKLTEENVLEIRRLSALGFPQRELGEAFGVTHTQIGYIVRRQQWTHI